MVYHRGTQRDGSPHYVFLYSDDENSGDEDSIPLQQRDKPASSPRKIEVINVPLKAEDTLQALALRYRCTISELKRINKIHKENEIHARRFIRVPVQPFSLLTETLEQNQSEQQDENEVSISTANEEKGTERNPVVAELPNSEINAIILNSVCEPLSSYNNVNTMEIASSENDQLIPQVESNRENTNLTDTFKCSGDDCGISWTQLLGFSLLLGFAGPIIIIYILYAVDFSSKNHSTADH
ncbi:lysM and putative peptidoglycan-binding domain-containing protein 3 isoform X2 [Ceratina calcarata]|nr:lysM and putative peptidoglycan-binding domain-containing protein 3 isoform X2 [Ceratina calcarata]